MSKKYGLIITLVDRTQKTEWFRTDEERVAFENELWRETNQVEHTKTTER